MIHGIIADGGGRGSKAKVEDNALLTSTYPAPPLVEQKTKIYRSYLLNGASSDMLVDGSTTAVDFSISADSNNDIYITALTFIHAYPSASALWAEWADDGAALTNGFKLSYIRKGESIDIHDAITVNGELMRLATTPDLSEKRSILLVNDYGFLVAMDIAAIMPPYGIKLDRGTKQKLTFTVQDDLTASNSTLLNCIAYGFERFE